MHLLCQSHVVRHRWVWRLLLLCLLGLLLLLRPAGVLHCCLRLLGRRGQRLAACKHWPGALIWIRR